MHFQIFYALCSLAGQIGLRHTTFAHLKVRTGLFHERFLCAFLLIRSVLRAPVLHPQPSYPRAGTSIARCQTWGSRTDLGLKAVGKRPGPDAQNGRWLFLPPSPPRAGQATCGQRKRRRVMSSTQGANRACQCIRDPRPSLTTRRLHQRPGNAHALARSHCNRPVRRGHRRWPRGSCLAAR